MADLRPDVLFVLVGSEGDGPIEQAAAARANVRVAPWAERPALAQWLGAADVLVIPPSLAPLQRFGDCVLPMKTFAYLAAGRPILAPIAPDTAELLRDGETALLVPPDQPEAAAAGLDRLLGDAALAARYRRQCPQTVRRSHLGRASGEDRSFPRNARSKRADHRREPPLLAFVVEDRGDEDEVERRHHGEEIIERPAQRDAGRDDAGSSGSRRAPFPARATGRTGRGSGRGCAPPCPDRRRSAPRRPGSRSGSSGWRARHSPGPRSRNSG